MPDYKAMYFGLFSAVTDAIEALQAAQAHILRLIKRRRPCRFCVNRL